MDALWIILTGMLVAGACAIPGCFLVLRRLSLLGDAISHSVLAGIVLAFLISGSRGLLPMLLGAMVLGLLTTLLTDFFYHRGKTPHDAALGVSFTAFFALGVVLIAQYADKIDLDVDCVLYGEILTAPFNRIVLGSFDLGPRSIWIMGGMTLVNAAVVAYFFTPLKIATFDPDYARAIGVPVRALHYLLMLLVSFTTVTAFENVGAILVVAFLTVPPNTAYLLTNRLSTMVGLAVLCGCLSAVGGYFAAAAWNVSISGAMVVMSGVLFALAALFAPRHGVLPRYWAQRRLAQ
jgi:manganese/zinc/iron transport system permease protein